MLYDGLCGMDLDWTGWPLYLFSFIVLSFGLRIRALIVDCAGKAVWLAGPGLLWMGSIRSKDSSGRLFEEVREFD